MLGGKFLARMEQLGHPMFMTCTWRDPKEQEALYAQGRTKPGQKVTNARAWQSKHCMTRITPGGKEEPGAWAFDVAFSAPPAKSIYEGPWELVGKAAKELGLVWGGSFRTLADKPHLELPDPIPAWFVRLHGGGAAK